MGRHEKIVLDVNGMDRRKTGFYVTPAFIADFIASISIELKGSLSSVYDPCIGDGAFVKPFLGGNTRIAGMDVLSFPLPSEIDFTPGDFIDFFRKRKGFAILGQSYALEYDLFVANPPYNCHEVDYIRENKKALSSAFDEVGVLNLYSMFISAMIDLAPPDSLIALLTLDSFLTAKLHQGLREKILSECAIHYLLLCPTDLFLSQGADVRTCILVLQKDKVNQAKVSVLNRLKSSENFRRVLSAREFETVDLSNMVLESDKDSHEFIVGVPPDVTSMFKLNRVGDLFPCITGISTGNDKKYIRKNKGCDFNTPFYKNPASRRFYCTPDGYLPDNYMEIAASVPNFMVRNKELLTNEGVVCSSMGVAFSACYRPAETTFGVNANIAAGVDCWWLLSYLNSSVVSYIVRGVLMRSNMVTSGYISRIPMPNFSNKAKRHLEKISKEAFAKQVSPDESRKYISQIDNFVYSELCLAQSTIETIKEFNKSIKNV